MMVGEGVLLGTAVADAVAVAVGAAVAVLLGVLQGDIAIAQQFVCRSGVLRKNCDSDAGCRDHFVRFEL